jgi:hypothetical protein
MSVNAGGYGGARVQSRLHAAVNARLEEISFRTGLITAMIALLALAAIATAGVFAATLSLGGTAVAAQGAPTTASARTVPATTAAAQPTMPAHPRATTPAHPHATTAPQATHPVTTAITRPQPTGGSQPWAEADGSQSSSRYYGRASFGNHGSWYGGHGSGYGGWPVHGGPGFPGQGFGSGPRGFGRP